MSNSLTVTNNKAFQIAHGTKIFENFGKNVSVTTPNNAAVISITSGGGLAITNSVQGLKIEVNFATQVGTTEDVYFAEILNLSSSKDTLKAFATQVKIPLIIIQDFGTITRSTTLSGWTVTKKAVDGDIANVDQASTDTHYHRFNIEGFTSSYRDHLKIEAT